MFLTVAHLIETRHGASLLARLQIEVLHHEIVFGASKHHVAVEIRQKRRGTVFVRIEQIQEFVSHSTLTLGVHAETNDYFTLYMGEIFIVLVVALLSFNRHNWPFPRVRRWNETAPFPRRGGLSHPSSTGSESPGQNDSW